MVLPVTISPPHHRMVDHVGQPGNPRAGKEITGKQKISPSSTRRAKRPEINLPDGRQEKRGQGRRLVSRGRPQYRSRRWQHSQYRSCNRLHRQHSVMRCTEVGIQLVDHTRPRTFQLRLVDIFTEVFRKTLSVYLKPDVQPRVAQPLRKQEQQKAISKDQAAHRYVIELATNKRKMRSMDK